jgi:ADP-dependent NAD(P)H-hydrate dehydratase
MRELTEDVLRTMPLPDPHGGDKDGRGHVLVIGGSAEVPGAALLAGTAALRSGAGRLRIATCKRHASTLALALPEAFVLGVEETEDGGIHPSATDQLLRLVKAADAVLLGPGMADQAAIDSVAHAILEKSGPGHCLVFDARAITALRRVRIPRGNDASRIIITPHAGEMASLLGQERSRVEAEPAHIAVQTARELRVTVVLKGARTFIAAPNQEECICREGNVGLATSGSGDVLAGLITGLRARGAHPFAAACWGVLVHAMAGDTLRRTVGPLGFLAREVLSEIPALLAALASPEGTRQ